ncbi:MAG: hypothetical protein HQL62_10825, partial [Magnetococcales bacterium]|nr:hypothetical protein [Magnetococcales bacterium]
MKNKICMRRLSALLVALLFFVPGRSGAAPPLNSPDLVALVKSLKPVVVN